MGLASAGFFSVPISCKLYKGLMVMLLTFMSIAPSTNCGGDRLIAVLNNFHISKQSDDDSPGCRFLRDVDTDGEPPSQLLSSAGGMMGDDMSRVFSNKDWSAERRSFRKPSKFQHEECHNAFIGNKSSDATVQMIFDFRKAQDLSNWSEFSDSRRQVGKSKAVLTLLRTGGSQRGILFTLLNPQTSGACFAGMRLKLNRLDLSGFTGLKIRGRAQGQHGRLKLAIRNDFNRSHQTSFELFRVLPVDGDTVVDAMYPFDQFEPYIKGVGPLPGIDHLDRSRIQDITLTAFGGVNIGTRVRGVASFELQWIIAYRK